MAGVAESEVAEHVERAADETEEALKAGADLLVVGRPITRAPDPGAAAAAIGAALRRAIPAP